MSLSFVSKSIQTSRDDGGYDEKPVESTGEGDGGQSSVTGARKPLFEQLRDNKEQEEAERAEFQRSIMRGTLALDEEDCAHLDAVEKKRQEEISARQQQTEQELDAFRAAQADRLEKWGELEAVSDDLKKEKVRSLPEKRAVSTLEPPKMLIKKRRRRQEPEQTTERNVSDTGGIDKSVYETEKRVERSTKEAEVQPNAIGTPSGGLGGLLSGYGSSDED